MNRPNQSFVKTAEREYVSPTSAALAGLVPLGGALHGTIAGHSPREGIRETTGQALGGTLGALVGGTLGALVGGTKGHASELAKGMSLRDLLLARLEHTNPDRLASATQQSLAAVKLRGLSGGLLGSLKGLGRGGLIGGALGGAVGAGIAAHGGNKVVRRQRINQSPVLQKIQDWVNQQTIK